MGRTDLLSAELVVSVSSSSVSSTSPGGDDDVLREACGIFGIIDSDDAAEQTALGLHALQHRGQDGCGIVSYDGRYFRAERALGLVGDSLAKRERMERLPGALALGHNRYATSGLTRDERDVQPMFAELDIGGVALAHNGNFTNGLSLRKKLVGEGSIFQSHSDSEVLIHLLARARGSLTERLLSVLGELRGGFAIGLLAKDMLIGLRDPHGLRPLLLGSTRDGGAIVASESCALDIIDAEYRREIAPGEVVVFSRRRVRGFVEARSFFGDKRGQSRKEDRKEDKKEDKSEGEKESGEQGKGRQRLFCASKRFAAPVARRSCVFEHIYFSRPDSLVASMSKGAHRSNSKDNSKDRGKDSGKAVEAEVSRRSIYQVRKRLGAVLAEEAEGSLPVCDSVVPIPDSGVAAALGFAERLGLSLDFAIIRNHYVGRTFIEPQQEIRHFGVRLKHNADRALLRGKRVVLIDDSLVRGTTSRKIIALVRQAGAKEVHMRIASPPITHPCHYGVDTPERGELLASRLSVGQMAKRIDCDSLAFLSEKGLYRALEGCEGGDSDGGGWCSACFTGRYPVELIDEEFGKAAYGQLSLLSRE